jgi:hypothetical protein
MRSLLYKFSGGKVNILGRGVTVSANLGKKHCIIFLTYSILLCSNIFPLSPLFHLRIYLFISITKRNFMSVVVLRLCKLPTLSGNGRDRVALLLDFQFGLQELENCKQRGDKKQTALILRHFYSRLQGIGKTKKGCILFPEQNSRRNTSAVRYTTRDDSCWWDANSVALREALATELKRDWHYTTMGQLFLFLVICRRSASVV